MIFLLVVCIFGVLLGVPATRAMLLAVFGILFVCLYFVVVIFAAIFPYLVIIFLIYLGIHFGIKYF